MRPRSQLSQMPRSCWGLSPRWQLGRLAAELGFSLGRCMGKEWPWEKGREECGAVEKRLGDAREQGLGTPGMSSSEG